MILILFKFVFINIKKRLNLYILNIILISSILVITGVYNVLFISDTMKFILADIPGAEYFTYVINIIIILITAWMLHYLNKSNIKLRSKEFYIYLMSGFEHRNIIKLFVIENIIVGICALIIGSAIGMLPAVLFTSIEITLHMIYVNILFFVLIYVFSFIISIIYLYRVNIAELSRSYAKNEADHNSNKKTLNTIFIVIFLLMLGAGLVFLIDALYSQPPDVAKLSVSLAVLTLGMFGLYFSFINILKKLNYKYKNIILIRLFLSKINTVKVVSGILSVLIFFSLASFKMALLNQTMRQLDYVQTTPFDIIICKKNYAYPDIDLDIYNTYIEENVDYIKKHEYNLYTNHKSDFNGQKNAFIKLSDYIILRDMLGYSIDISLDNNEFLLHIPKKLNKYFDKTNEIVLNENIYNYKTSYNEPLSQKYINGDNLLIITHDENVFEMEKYANIIAVTTEKPVSDIVYDELLKLEHKRNDDINQFLLYTKNSYTTTANVRITLTSSILIYFGVFCMI